MTNTEKTAEAIRGLCEEHRLSIASLAENAGIGDKTMRRKLNAPDKFNLGELAAIARTLDTTLEKLVKA